MKKQLFYILLIAGFVNILSKTNAQNVYVNVNGGYGLAAGAQSVIDCDKEGTGNDFKINNSMVKYSLGKGINANLSVGYLFNKNFGAELGFGYLIGSKTAYNDITNIVPDVKVSRSFKSNMLYFVPSLVLESGFKTINPYAKVGVIIGMPKVTEEYLEDDQSILAEKLETTTEYKMDLGLGVNTCIGVMFNISEKLSFFGECRIVNMSVTPKSGKYTKYSVDNFDMLWMLTTNEKEQVYLKELTSDSSVPNESEPAKLMKYKMPFSSVGGNIGVKISF